MITRLLAALALSWLLAFSAFAQPVSCVDSGGETVCTIPSGFLSNVVEDTSPSLGGSLDADGFDVDDFDDFTARALTPSDNQRQWTAADTNGVTWRWGLNAGTFDDFSGQATDNGAYRAYNIDATGSTADSITHAWLYDTIEGAYAAGSATSNHVWSEYYFQFFRSDLQFDVADASGAGLAAGQRVVIRTPAGVVVTDAEIYSVVGNTIKVYPLGAVTTTRQPANGDTIERESATSVTSKSGSWGTQTGAWVGPDGSCATLNAATAVGRILVTAIANDLGTTADFTIWHGTGDSDQLVSGRCIKVMNSTPTAILGTVTSSGSTTITSAISDLRFSGNNDLRPHFMGIDQQSGRIDRSMFAGIRSRYGPPGVTSWHDSELGDGTPWVSILGTSYPSVGGFFVGATNRAVTSYFHNAVALYDGSLNYASIVTAALAGDRTHTLPNLGGNATLPMFLTADIPANDDRIVISKGTAGGLEVGAASLDAAGNLTVTSCSGCGPDNVIAEWNTNLATQIAIWNGTDSYGLTNSGATLSAAGDLAGVATLATSGTVTAGALVTGTGFYATSTSGTSGYRVAAATTLKVPTTTDEVRYGAVGGVPSVGRQGESAATPIIRGSLNAAYGPALWAISNGGSLDTGDEIVAAQYETGLTCQDVLEFATPATPTDSDCTTAHANGVKFIVFAK